MKPKYDFRRLGEHTFRIRFDKTNEGSIRYEIQPPVNIPRNLWERIYQFFTVGYYHLGYWFSWQGDTLDERITEMMSAVVAGWDSDTKLEKTWADL